MNNQKQKQVKPDRTAGLVPTGTAVVWVCLTAIGLTQLLTHRPPPAPSTTKPDAIVLAINVSLGDPPPPAGASQADAPDPVPVEIDPLPNMTEPPPPTAPALIPILTVPPRKKTASPARSATPSQQSSGPAYQAISYGTGEGDQPAPEYPTEADEAGQRGTVVVRFDVQTDGSVANVNVFAPSVWPLLNNAAQRSIRDTWSYPPGPVRHYQVSIVYEPKHGS